MKPLTLRLILPGISVLATGAAGCSSADDRGPDLPAFSGAPEAPIPSDQLEPDSAGESESASAPDDGSEAAAVDGIVEAGTTAGEIDRGAAAVEPSAGGNAPAGGSEADDPDGAGDETDAASDGAPPETAEPSIDSFGTPLSTGSGESTERYQAADVTRDGRNYYFMANGWGPGFESHSVSWNGTAFTVNAMQGSQGPNYQPASYPTVFCGEYSTEASGECGLPVALSELTALRTGWMWRPNGNDGEYNAAYDIWMSTGTARSSFSGFMMVWLREPPGQQPAGSLRLEGVSVQNVPGTWDVWTGTVGNRPIVNWVRAEGDDSLELEFDVLDFVRDAEARGIELPGDHVLSVAVGFEIWNGPVENLQSLDFYVDVQR